MCLYSRQLSFTHHMLYSGRGRWWTNAGHPGVPFQAHGVIEKCCKLSGSPLQKTTVNQQINFLRFRTVGLRPNYSDQLHHRCWDTAAHIPIRIKLIRDRNVCICRGQDNWGCRVNFLGGNSWWNVLAPAQMYSNQSEVRHEKYRVRLTKTISYQLFCPFPLLHRRVQSFEIIIFESKNMKHDWGVTL